MGKLINLNGDADKNKTLQKILEQLDTLKDELAELLSASEDTDTDSAGMDALTEALDALVFDYDSVVGRDSLDLTASAGDLIKAVTVVDGKTVSYKTADTEAMTRIAAGMTALKPQEFASFHATGPELTSAGLTEDQRMTLDVEFSNGGNTESLTVYVGNFVDVMGEKRYLQMEGSNMIAIVDAAVIGDLLNLTEEQNSIQNTK